MEKELLTKEQVEEIINALEEEDFKDETEYYLSGDGKTTYVNVDVDFDGKVTVSAGFLNDDCHTALPSPTYQHSLEVLDYVFTGEEKEDCKVDWELNSDKYKMPGDKELLDSLTEALEEHKEDCYFGLDVYSCDDIWDEWDEDEIRDLINEELSGSNFVKIDGELYCYDNDVNEILENLGLDQDSEYTLLTFDEGVEFLLEQDINLY